jgi:2-polyprenyl-6-hydroxyphenyl methylase/3-demethylubiquinone-9 3-methyltransferase
MIATRGFDVTAVDVSTTGIEQARIAFSSPKFYVASAYDDLAEKFGTFDILVSLEVVEHLYFPRKWAANIGSLLNPGGLAIVSTPYHGYLKNLLIAVSGRLDSHMDPLWDHGHIKFWSIRTLRKLLTEASLEVESIHRLGRVPVLAKSMVMTARKRGHGSDASG